MMDIPWREKLVPARLMDTHSVYLEGGPADPQIQHLEDVLMNADRANLAWPARKLFELREFLGRLLGWDDEKSTPKISPDSYFWKMSDEERQRCVREPGRQEGPALILWNDRHSVCLEVLNATCQAFAVGYIENRSAHLSVFVIETRWWSKYYLALIEPFRKYIVYPAMVKWVSRVWRERYLR